MPRPLRRPSLRPLVAASLAAAAPSLAAAQSGGLSIEPVRYGAYAGTAVPIRARWQPGAAAPTELVDTLVVWRSTNSLTAWVGLDGQLYFDRPGRVTLTATRGGVSTARAFEVVEPRADRLTIAGAPAADGSIRAGDTLALAVRAWAGERETARDARIAYGIGVRGAAARAASVDTAGRFTAAAPGGYRVLAMLGALGASTVVPVAGSDGAGPTVTAPLPRDADRGDGVREVKIATVGDYEPYVGTSIPLVARVRSEGVSARPVVWSSDDPATAWVDGDGMVHFLKRGSVEIAATAGGHRATRSFHVRESEAYRVLLRASVGETTAVVGDPVRLNPEAWVVGGARLRNARLELAVWTADGAVAAPRATIDEDGVFVAHAPGTYTIMTSIAGHASSVVVTVDAPAAAR